MLKILKSVHRLDCAFLDDHVVLVLFQSLGEKTQLSLENHLIQMPATISASSEQYPSAVLPGVANAIPHAPPPAPAAANQRYHPYQRENSNAGSMKAEIRIDPRLARKPVGLLAGGGKDKPKDPRLLVPPPPAPVAAKQTLINNQVNTNRDPRQRR